MAFSVNKVILVGHLGQDAEHRFTTNNCVTTFSIATTHSYKKDDKWVNDTTWHNVTAFDLPDWFKDALKKGSKWYVEGRLKNEEYTDKEGVNRKVTKIIADKYNGLIPLSEAQPSQEAKPETKEQPETTEPDDDLPF